MNKNILIFIEGQRLDLFGNDNITINQSKQNVNDISKVFTDFTQSFSVPASDNNNFIFKHFYNVDIDNGFDARVRKNAVIYLDGLDFKSGKIQLNSVKIKDNEAKSYSINFFGKTINIKDDIGDDKLVDLDWLDNFDRDYTGDEVKTGLETGIDVTVGSTTYVKALAYPLISYKRQFLYNSDPSDVTSSDTLVNIAYDAGRTDGIVSGNLKPVIGLPVIMEAINQKYSNFNFSGGFLDSPRFTGLYMNLNNNTESISNGTLIYDSATGTIPYPSFFIGDLVYVTSITPNLGFESVPYRIKLTLQDQIIYESEEIIGATGTIFSNLVGGRLQNIDIEENVNYTVKAEIITSQDFEFDFTTDLDLDNYIGSDVNVYDNSGTNQSIDLLSEIRKLLPDYKVYDFLTDLIKLFNLTIEENNGVLEFNTLPNWYSEGNIYDITKYVDTQSSQVSKGKIYNQLNFNFKESNQIIADEYRQNNNIGYGDIEERLYTDSTETELLDGETLDIKVGFENPVFERLYDQDDNSLTTIQYCPYINRELQSIVGNPFLMYLNDVNVSDNSLGFVNDNTYEEINTSVLMPSHSQTINFNSFNINFDAVANEYTYEVFQDTLYNRFYSDYISDIYSIKRRMFNFDAILPQSILLRLKMNDRLIIKGRRYIINTIQSNLTNRSDTLELINDIYDAPLASDTLNTSTFVDSVQTNPAQGGSNSNTYIGLPNKTISVIDIGDGIGWISGVPSTTSLSVEDVNYTLSLNATGSTRSAQIQVTDNINNPSFTIRQIAAVLNNITMDSTSITFDNNNITMDNG